MITCCSIWGLHRQLQPLDQCHSEGVAARLTLSATWRITPKKRAWSTSGARQTLYFVLSERRDEAAALSFLAKAVTSSGLPRSCAIDNIVEQDHREVKRRIKPMMGFKSLGSARATLDGIDAAHMIRKGQLGKGCPFALCASLAA